MVWNQLDRQFVVYCDYECNLIKSKEKNVLHTHERNYVAFFCVCTYNNKHDLLYYVSQDCLSKLLIKLHELFEQFLKEMNNSKKIIMSDEDYIDFDNATYCLICKRKVYQIENIR